MGIFDIHPAFRRTSTCIAVLICTAAPAFSLELPDTGPLVDWVESAFVATSFGDVLGSTTEPSGMPAPAAANQIKVEFLINQCTTDIEAPVDLFSNPMRVAEFMNTTGTQNIGVDRDTTVGAPSIPLPRARVVVSDLPAATPQPPAMTAVPAQPVAAAGSAHIAQVPLPAVRPDLDTATAPPELTGPVMSAAEPEMPRPLIAMTRTEPAAAPQPIAPAPLPIIAPMPQARLARPGINAGVLPESTFHTKGSFTYVAIAQR